MPSVVLPVVRVPAGLYARGLRLLAVATVVVDSPFYVLAWVLGSPILVAVLASAPLVLLLLAYYLSRAGWLGVVAGDGVVVARVLGCRGVVVLTLPSGAARPVEDCRGVLRGLRGFFCGVGVPGGRAGVYLGRRGWRAYVVAVEPLEAGVYVEHGGVAVIACGPVGPG